MNEIKNIDLKLGTVFLLSGIPGSGKSTFLKNNNIPKNMIVSLDQLRLDVFGETFSFDEHGSKKDPVSSQDYTISTLAKKIFSARVSENLTMFVDATLISDKERSEWATIASHYGVDVNVLIFDVPIEQIISQDSKRDYRVGENVINQFNSRFEKTSKYNYYIVNSNTKINLIPNSLPHSKIDVVGDTHGMKVDAINLLSKLGYNLENNIFVHKEDKERKILFLGDFVDRGQDSIEMLKLVKKQTESGHFAIVGNHENKLINFYSSYINDKNNKSAHVSSLSSALTAMSFAKLEKQEQNELYQWLIKLPSYYVYDNVAFTHSGLQSFKPDTNLRSSNIYGDVRKGLRNVDIEKFYDDNRSLGIVNYFLIHGHKKLTSEQNSVISLDNDICFKNGEMLAIKLDEVLEGYKNTGIFNNQNLILRESIDFDFNEILNKGNFSLYRALQNLEKNKLANYSVDDTGLLKIFKYSKSVFFDRLWSEHESLLKCRGIVFDLAGNIVQHPFDKVFNYQEINDKKEATGENIKDDENVQVIEKLNGFLGCVTKHPFKNDLLVTTTGSFDSDFVGYIFDLIKSKNHYGGLLKYLNMNPQQTLMFEVIHKEDPHIIEYNESEQDIYLIGVRDKDINSKILSEKDMDIIAEQIGIRRPKHFVVTFKEAKDIIKNSKLEGYMVRNLTNGDYECKFKTPYYLVTKFLARLSEKNIKMMYGNVKAFKQKIDEEFYDITDKVVSTFTLSEFLNLDKNVKVKYIRNIISDLRSNNSDLNSTVQSFLEKQPKVKKNIVNKI